MYKMFALLLIIVGVALLIFGIMASQSLYSEVSRFFTGTLSDKAVWMLISGTILSIIGLVWLMRQPKKVA